MACSRVNFTFTFTCSQLRVSDGVSSLVCCWYFHRECTVLLWKSQQQIKCALIKRSSADETFRMLAVIHFESVVYLRAYIQNYRSRIQAALILHPVFTPFFFCCTPFPRQFYTISNLRSFSVKRPLAGLFAFI